MTECSVRILGTVRLDVGGQLVGVSRLEAGLLARLCTVRETTVSWELLSHWLWGEEPPASARNRVQALVSGLRRKAGCVPLIETQGPAYRLAGDVHTDYRTWTDLTGSANSASDPGPFLEQALGLFDASPLTNCPDTPEIDLERLRLSEERLTVVADRIDADLVAGRVGSLVAELTTLTQHRPYDERLHSQLMLALTQTGRQADALELYRATHRRLSDELGVSPGQQLRDTNQQILTGDVTAARSEGEGSPGAPKGQRTALQANVPRTLPRNPGVVVGRERELATIGVLAAGDSSASAVVNIVGLGGIGKSALALEAAQRLQPQFPDGCLYIDFNSETGRSGVSAALALFLRLVGVAPESVPTSQDEREALFRTLTHDKSLVVVLDDVPCDLDVRPLLPSGSGSVAMVTSRWELHDLDPTQLIRLSPLEETAAIDLLASVIGEDAVEESREDAARLIRLCDGFPLLVRLLAGRIAARADLDLATVVEDLLDTGEHWEHLKSVDQRISAGLGLAEAPLSPPARNLLGRLADLPFRMTSQWFGRALVPDAADARQAMEELVATGFLEPVVVKGTNPRYRMHDVVRWHVTGDAVPGPAEPSTPVSAASASPQMVHAAEVLLAEALRQGTAYPVQCLPFGPPSAVESGGCALTAERSQKFFATENQTILVAARHSAHDRPDLAWRLLTATSNHAFTALEPQLWLSTADEVRPHLQDAAGSAYLDLAEAALRHEWGQSDVAIKLALPAHEVFLSEGNAEGAVTAAVTLGRSYRTLGRGADAEDMLRFADELVGGLSTCHQAYVALAWGLLHDAYDRVPEADADVSRALELFTGSMDWSGWANAAMAMAESCRRLRKPELGLAHSEEALRLFAKVGDQRGHAAASDVHADLLLRNDEPGEALSYAESAVSRAREMRDPFAEHRAERTRARALKGLGRMAEARVSYEASAHGFARLGWPLSLAASLHDLGLFLSQTNQHAEAVNVLIRERQCLIDSGHDDTTEVDELIEHSRRLAVDSIGA